MRIAQRTVPADDLLSLLVQRAGLRVWSTARDIYITTMLALLAAADKIRSELAECEANWRAGLDKAGVVAKVCPDCRTYFAASRHGRPRKYCWTCRPVRDDRMDEQPSQQAVSSARV